MSENAASSQLNRENVDSLCALPPGSVVDLQITTPTAPRRVKTAYVGMELATCMIFQIPTSAKWMVIRDLLTIGNDIVVRFVLEGGAGQVIAFRVKVLKLLAKPSGLLITSFPRSIESIGLRANKRAQPGIAVKVSSEAFPEAEQVTGIIVDISNNGCRIALPLKPEWPIMIDETKIALVYSTDGNDSTLNAIVKNHQLESEFVYYGLKFDSDEEAVNTLLSGHTLIT
ncbi:PilZ domain-containing protein [Alteromonas sp. 1_MG-2023]|uniref:PilZ domain-containing protein n=1 Tax=Alteromonas sp. 1_MG-2023 TaxID=3062669 RepID=UPI0026E34F09|nr:PilZ domain-containing protein [Alteromonas sp. 1_MG-2023]MDO6565938.1 PilZ domain-containing protein [Alteromonas sp. 1_MG-2023]